MAEAIGFFRSLEIWIYLLFGSIGLIFIRKFILAWQELKGAGFGLERESAQERLNQAASILVLLIALAVSEFVLVSFVAPAVPGAIPLMTPTVDIFSTPTITLSPSGIQPSGVVTATAPAAVSGCVPGEIELTGPQNGTEVSGVVEVNGTASILNFGFYKIEMKRPDESVWLTLQAGNVPVKGAKLGDWDTRRLSPGEYQLSLVVVDNQARSSLPCIVQVRVTKALEATATP